MIDVLRFMDTGGSGNEQFQFPQNEPQCAGRLAVPSHWARGENRRLQRDCELETLADGNPRRSGEPPTVAAPATAGAVRI
jgi:hypothetical protein